MMRANVGAAASRWAAAIAGIALALVALAAAAQDEPPVVRFSVERFVVDGDNPLSGEETASILSAYTGDHAGLDGLLAAADALERAMQSRGHAFHRVVFPPQTLEGGAVTLRVAVFAVDRVRVRGNRHFSEENIRRSLPVLTPGWVPNTRIVGRALGLAREHPSKDIELTFRESREKAALDAVVDVTDRRPWQVYATLNNTGTAATGPLRLGVGALHTNLFGRDHAASATYTTSPGHAGQVQQWGATYGAPLYRWASQVSGYFVRSDVDTGTVGAFDVAGRGDFVGLRYTYHLPKRRRLDHRVTVGVDDKRFDTRAVLTGGGASLFPVVRSRPVSVRYSALFKGEEQETTVYAEYVRNWVAGGGNTGAAYAANRVGAKPSWEVVRAGGSLVQSLAPGWLLRGLAEAQYTNEPLIAGEQYGLGGFASVRGFDEREVAADRGFRFGFELWGPELPFAVRWLGFLDWGLVDRKSPLPGEVERDAIGSAGLGVRWQWRDHLSLSLDVAQVLEGTAGRPGGTRGHLGIVVRY